MSYKVGQRVEVSGKDCQGAIAYVGHPSFAAGKWIGVILDEPKGKNNGSVKGQAYFKCAENHGMFVRQTQLILLDDAGNPIEMSVPSPTVSSSTSQDGTSAARARSRLNSSRLSLVGSRTQLDSPSTENLATSQHERKDIGESHIPAPTMAKRASFVEKSPSTSSHPSKKAQDDRNNTGFVETLKPQFVPGQAMGLSMTSSSVEEKLSHLQISQENDNFKAQIRDLNEKVNILRSKRIQDKERMKDFEKTKLQVEQLLEFKSKVMESQASLQRELQRAKQETRDAHVAREQYQEEMESLSETVEMATLDKEMAEEKAETLQMEMEQLQEKVEELTLDLELLRTEMSERSGGNNATTAATSYEVKQLEQQNARLRETLVRMRDLSAHEKHEFQKLQKDLDHAKSEITELGRTKEKLSQRVEDMEHQISDLQEQVDAALGAEEMVEALGERKMALEEKVTELEEAVADLEALQDMSDQLAESSRELELELREELDMALAQARDSQRHRDAALETLSDREQTIAKFRELTQQLQQQCVQLQERLHSNESSLTGSRGPDQQLADILEFQKTFAETKAQTKAIDLELRRLEAEEARNHVNHLLSFMPPAFMTRGGDHDAISALLLVPRMTQKTEILISQVRDKYPPIEKCDRAAVVKGHSVAQYSFRSRLCSHMYALQTALGCFESGLNFCTPEMLLKVGTTYPEMVAQEKSLDLLIELVKKDQLDENLPMDAIEKCCSYFINMYCILFGESDLTNQARLVANGTRMLGSCCEVIATDAAAIKTLIDGEAGDIGRLCQHAETACEVVQQHLKSARIRIPREHMNSVSPSGAFLGLSKDWTEQMSTCYQHAVKVMKTTQDLLKSALQAIINNGDLESGLKEPKLMDMAAMSSEKIYDTEDLGPVNSVKSSLTVLQQAAANLAQKMTECENELAITGKAQQRQQVETGEQSISPILMRAQAVRKEADEVKNLSKLLEKKDSDIREMKLGLRDKQGELSEMSLRKELVEKRLTNQQHDFEMSTEKLNRRVEELTNQLKRKEKEFEETMDHLQSDLDNLESEKGQLKEKLKTFGKKMITSISGDDLGSNSVERMLMQEITGLREALRHENEQKCKLMAVDLKRKLNALEPLPTLPDTKSMGQLQELSKRYQNLKNEILKVQHTVPDLTLSIAKRRQEEMKKQQLLKTLKDQSNKLFNDVQGEAMKRSNINKLATNFGTFQSPEMAAALRDSKQLLAAQIKIPYNGPAECRRLNVGLPELRKIHMLLNY